MGRRGWFDRGNRQRDQCRELKDEISRRGIRLFSRESLVLATAYFETLIGRGGYANVFRGVLEDGLPVAVKVYKPDGYALNQDFVEVIDVLSHIRHKNLNRVIGCCVDNDGWMLVSEYIEDGTLYDLIGDSDRRRSIFTWKKRVAVCIGIARGISYLHEDIHPRVIHRDIKPGNVLLDSNLTPIITDFDSVAFVYDDQDLPLEDLVQGTMGYLDPEYFQTSQFTEKLDGYGFGVVMLEVISGRRAIEYRYGSYYESDADQNITSWASRLVASDRQLEVVDPLLTDFPKDDALRFIDVALLCIQEQSERRPSMSEVVLMLCGVCNPCSQALRDVHMRTSSVDIQAQVTSIEDDEESNTHFTLRVSATMSGVSNSSESEAEAQGDPNDGSVSAQVSALSNNLQTEGGEWGERDRTQGQSNAATAPATATVLEVTAQQPQMMNPGGIMLSASGCLVERLSQTRVFTENTQNYVCPEAVYPPFRTRVFTQNIKNHSNNHVCPEAVYPPFRTRVFRRLGSRNLYTFEAGAQSGGGPEDDISTRLSQTTVFNKHYSTNVCNEAVYPPFQTSVFRRHGSRNLYAF